MDVVCTASLPRTPRIRPARASPVGQTV